MTAFRANAWREAIREFELAYALAPQPELWFNIARAREQLGEYELAIEGYRRYLRDRIDAPDRAAVEENIRALEVQAAHARLRRTGEAAPTTVQFDVATQGARLFLDERMVATAPSAALIVTTPGPHTVRVQADGMREWRAELTFRQGAPARVIASLAPETRYRTIARPHVVSAVLAGLGAASLLTSGVFGVQALSAGCSGCDDRDRAAARSDVFLGITAGLAVGAAVVYFLERGASRTERVTTP